MRKFTYLMMVLLLSSSVLFAQNITQEESDFLKMKLMQKEAALGSVTYDNGDKGVDAIGDDCTDPFLYGNINDAAQTGFIASYGAAWFSFTGPDDLTVTASLCASSYDTKIEVWNDCADGTYAFYNDDACSAQSEVVGIPFIGGSTMYVKVYGYSSSSGNYELEITGVPPPQDPDPIMVFPFEEDFESGVFSDMTVALTAPQSDLVLNADAAQGGSFGAQFEGGYYTGWSSYSTVDEAFANVEHVAKLQMIIEPIPGAPDPFLMEFDLKQKYTYNNQNYEWFRVLVDGVPIADVDGNLYHQASTPMADNFARITYDLSAYQGLGSFELILENAGKYDPGYSTSYDGDIAQLDNLSIYYNIPPAVPLSNWAFALIGLLAMTLVFIKFRR
ncbi:MAG: hypothetical protein GQ527_03390 [Bacteroidales bacterium]|nr:hypothetical protein [Bacteroidales bacterium]